MPWRRFRNHFWCFFPQEEGPKRDGPLLCVLCVPKRAGWELLGHCFGPRGSQQMRFTASSIAACKCISYLKAAKARTVLISSAVPLQSKSSVCLKRCFGTPVQNLPAAGSTGNGRGSRLEVALATGRTRPRQSPCWRGSRTSTGRCLSQRGSVSSNMGLRWGFAAVFPNSRGLGWAERDGQTHGRWQMGPGSFGVSTDKTASLPWMAEGRERSLGNTLQDK